LARCIIATFGIPRGIRRDTTLEIILEGMPNPPISLTFNGSELKRIPSGELDTAAIIHSCLSGNAVQGVSLRRRSFPEAVRRLADDGLTLYYLHEKGRDSRDIRFAEKPAFILGDHKGLDPSTERDLDAAGAERVSVGPHSYLASHCITVVNFELDMVNR